MWNVDVQYKNLKKSVYDTKYRSADQKSPSSSDVNPPLNKRRRGGSTTPPIPSFLPSFHSGEEPVYQPRTPLNTPPSDQWSSQEGQRIPLIHPPNSAGQSSSASQHVAPVDAKLGDSLITSIHKCAQRAYTILRSYNDSFMNITLEFKGTAKAIATKFILAMHAHGELNKKKRVEINTALKKEFRPRRSYNYFKDEITVFRHVEYKYICNDLPSESSLLYLDKVDELITAIKELELEDEELELVDKERLKLELAPSNNPVIDTTLTLGEGSFGSVHPAAMNGKDLVVKVLKRGIPTTGMTDDMIREVCIIQSLSHPNIVQFVRVNINQKGLVWMYMERMVDLEVTNRKIHVTGDGARIRKFVKGCVSQLVEGLSFLHDRDIIHRDLKPANILVLETKKGRKTYKISDLGLARYVSKVARVDPSSSKESFLTTRVGTRWYRAPELLLGATEYTNKIDVFSLGCIVVELCTGFAWLPGVNDKDQIALIFEALGAPTTDYFLKIVPGWANLVKPGKKPTAPLFDPQFENSKELQKNQVCELVGKMTTLDPHRRISIQECKKEPFLLPSGRQRAPLQDTNSLK